MEKLSDDDSYETTSKSWLGTSMAHICDNKGPWNFYLSAVKPSVYHHVLYDTYSVGKGQLAPYHTEQLVWDDDHVRMPFSAKNLFPVVEDGVEVLKPQWEIIKKALSEPINSIHDLEKAINKYNGHLPKFQALHNYVDTLLEEAERNQFFTCLLPGIIDLALRLPEIVTSNIPLLKKNENKSVSLSQVQIASLLANAFLCTFPFRTDIAALSYPGADFIRLFTTHSRSEWINCVTEKLKCICHYFYRILSNSPTGVVTFERKYIPENNMPRWVTLDKNLGNVKIHIDSTGTIEDNGLGCLQIDFANKNIGGGVLGYGCVQEEIRFIICPELIISRLFVEQLGDYEAVVITGTERYSKYEGYGGDFTWAGNFIDETPFDEFGRRKTSIAVIDALYYGKFSDQFSPSAMLRDLNKAYTGFSSRETQNLAPVATGNWGCGAFNGDCHLKALLQLMACCAANRDLIYYSFGDEQLRDDFYNMHLFLVNNQITVMQIWRFLSRFENAKVPYNNLYSYIQQSYIDSKTQRNVKHFFKISKSSSDGNSSVLSTSKKEENKSIKSKFIQLSNWLHHKKV